MKNPIQLTFNEYQKGTRTTAAYAEAEKEALRLERFRDIPIDFVMEELKRLTGASFLFDRMKKHIRDGDVINEREPEPEYAPMELITPEERDRRIAKLGESFRKKMEEFGTQRLYVFFGLFSEVGEIGEVFRDFITDDIDGDVMRKRLRKEIGDVLWYLSELAFELYSDESLQGIAAENLKKLASRKRRGKIHGSGDER
jgi:NTP pyrophosphatase (non-canonical NTP hydrolase)